MNVFGMYGGLSGLRPAARTGNKVNAFTAQIRRLENNLAKTLMINEALWEIIRDRLNLTEQELHDKLYEVDMRDGTLDGKNQRKAVKCQNCDHMVSARHSVCIYCGQVMDNSVFTVD